MKVPTSASDFETPPPLEEGDRVAIVSPASGLAHLFPHVYERGIERLQSTFNLEPVEYPTALKPDEELFDNPQERAADIERAFADPDISGVIATIGGNDQIRILDYLDEELIRANPTRFYGSSDNTNLAHFLWNQGIVSYYGGNLLTELAASGPLPDYLEDSLKAAFFDETVGEIDPAPRFTDEDLDWNHPKNLELSPEMEANPGWIWRGATDRSVEGRTWGGSLEITHLQVAADRYLPSTSALEGTVLLLETCEELPDQDQVQRMLIGLGERGLLSSFAGVLVGRIKARSHAIDRSADEREAYREQLRNVMTAIIGEYNPTAPIVFNVDFGHTHPIVPVPIGGTVRIEPNHNRIEFV